VIAFPEGAAGEIVQPGVNGFLVPDEAGMAAAVRDLPEVSPAECRASVAGRYAVEKVVAGYEAVYGRVLAGSVVRGG